LVASSDVSRPTLSGILESTLLSTPTPSPTHACSEYVLCSQCVFASAHLALECAFCGSRCVDASTPCNDTRFILPNGACATEAPMAPSGLPTSSAIIVGSAGGGALVLLISVIALVVCLKRRSPRVNAASSTAMKPKSIGTYAMPEEGEFQLARVDAREASSYGVTSNVVTSEYVSAPMPSNNVNVYLSASIGGNIRTPLSKYTNASLIASPPDSMAHYNDPSVYH